jgi:hypothetical protein
MNSTFTKLTRFLLGLILVFFGLNKFFDFVTPTLAHEAKVFIQSLGETGYLMQIVGVFEISIGFMLIFKKWVPFALMMLVPISINILLFHLFLDLPGVGGALVVSIINIILIYKYWSSYKTLFI